MARPLKSGLDYFPLDVNFDDQVELIEAEFGLEGFAILIKLWQKIYANGYFIQWDEDTALLFSKKNNAEKNLVSSVINSCLLRNIFSKSIYETYGILTSNGIQKRYITACCSAKRKCIAMEERFLLVNDRYKELITELIPYIPEETRINPEVSTQRKGKEKKKDIYISVQTLSMSEEEYNKLVALYGKSAVDEKIEYARNYKKLKNYVSLYLTLNNWLRKDCPPEGKGKPESQVILE